MKFIYSILLICVLATPALSQFPVKDLSSYPTAYQVTTNDFVFINQLVGSQYLLKRLPFYRVTLPEAPVISFLGDCSPFNGQLTNTSGGGGAVTLNNGQVVFCGGRGGFNGTNFFQYSEDGSVKLFLILNGGVAHWVSDPGSYTSGGGSGGGLLNNLLAYYKMDDVSGGLVDATGNGYTASETGASPTYSQGGIINAAVLFNGGDELAATSLNISAGNAFSVSFWVNSTSGGGYVLKDWSYDVSSGFFIYQNGDGTLQVQVRPSGGSLNTPTSITGGGWHQVVLTLDTLGNFNVYIDGAVSSSATGWSMGTTQIGLTFGGTSGVTIDEAGLWSVALTSSQITQLYNSGSGLPFSSFTN